MRVEVKVEGTDELIAAFRTVEKGLDFRELGTWDAVAAKWYEIERGLFESEGASGKSGKWKALSSGCETQKQKKYGSVPILFASGEMARSLTKKGAKDSVLEKTANTLTIGTTNKKAGYHQRGNSRLPQRKVIDFTSEQLQEIASPILPKMKQLIANAKLRDLRG